MLLQLSIRNIAVIESAEITFGDGLNILTGETGAGKSIIIDSVNLILGERADRALVRAGAESAYVEALFDISECTNTRKTLYEMFEDDESELVISREISSVGRNVCRINGRMATLAQLSQITKDLIDIHGQHEHQSLLNPNNHILVLDAFCKNELKAFLDEYKTNLKEYNSVCDSIKSVETDGFEKQRRLDMLSFQFKEIDSLSLQPGEEEELKSQREILQNAEKIKDSLDGAYSAFFGDAEMDGGIVGRYEFARRSLADISNVSDKYRQIAERLESVIIESDDIAQEIRALNSGDSFEEGDLDAIETRLSDINKLKRKYGQSVEEILEYKDSVKKQIDSLEESEFVIGDLLKKKKGLYGKLEELAGSITKVRREMSEKLSQNIMQQLSQLGMERAKFAVNIEQKLSSEGELIFQQNGADSVEFIIATNPGEELKPMTKIASGGELSRIMLALKTISSETDKIATVIFDEIDTGISGNMASVVAQKLSSIAVKHQVICVTHTAQIAAMADVHHFIEKQTDETRAKTEVNLLDENERYMEISRLVGGTGISQYSDAHAKEIIAWSKEYKKSLKS